MPTSFVFSEAKIRGLNPPRDGRDREYHKDKQVPGLQVCVTAAGAKTYYFVRRIDGRPTRVLLGTTKELSVETARDAARVKAGDVAKGGNPQTQRKARREEPTLQVLYDHWMIYARAHKKPSSVAGDEWLWKRYLETWAKRRLGSIKKADVQARHAEIGREHGIYAANRMLALLRAMLNKADELGHRGDNPAKGIKMFREESRDRFLQPGELKAFFDALALEEGLFKDFFLVALLTGARRSNVQAMRWDELDLTQGVWRIPETKGGMAVIVPLVTPVVNILAARAGASKGSPWVFPGRRRNGEHLKEPKGAWKRILKRAKLTDLRPHDLRRSLGSYMAGQNISLTIIGRALGHKSTAATMIYSRLALDPVRAAVDQAATAILTGGGQTKLLGVENLQEGNHGQNSQD